MYLLHVRPVPLLLQAAQLWLHDTHDISQVKTLPDLCNEREISVQQQGHTEHSIWPVMHEK